MKRTFVVVLALAALAALAAPALFAAGGTEAAVGPAVKVNLPPALPIVNEKITLKGFGRLDPQHGPWDKMTLWIDHEARTNIHVNWETPGQDNVNERKNLVLASGDLPDFFIKTVLTESDVVKYGADGALIPLEGLIDKWAPNLKKIFELYPETRPTIMAPDNHIYSLPRITDFLPGLVWRSPLLNMAWIKRLNIEVPRTSDEFVAMLRRFRDEDPNGNGKKDEIPFTSHNPDFAMMAIGGMYGVRFDLSYDRRYANTIEKGKLHFQLADPEYRDALRAYSVLFREKLLDNDIFTHTDKDYFGKGAAGRVGFTPLYQPRNFATHANEYDAIVPPKGPRGHQIWNFIQVRVENVNTFSITRADRHPEATMRWIDWFYSDEGSTAIYLVRPNEFGSFGADGKFAFKKEIIEAPIGFEKYMGQHTIYPGGGAGGWFREAQMASGMAGTPMMFYVEKTKPYLINTIRPGLRSAAATERENQLRADLDVYVTETMAKFAAGQLDVGNDAAWDTWVKTLDKLGLRELEKILQETISR